MIGSVLLIAARKYNTIRLHKVNIKLEQAIMAGKYHAAKYYLNHGVDPNFHNSYYPPPIINAIQQNSIPIVTLLLHHGANVNEPQPVSDFSPLQIAIFAKSHKTSINLVRVLLASHANVFYRNIAGDDALMSCAFSGSISAFKMIYALDPNLADKDTAGDSLLLEAVMGAHFRMVTYLLHLGLNVNTTDKTGETALLFATQRTHYPIVKLLITSGAKVNVTDSAGDSPLLNAIQLCSRSSPSRTIYPGKHARGSSKTRFNHTDNRSSVSGGKDITLLLKYGAQTNYTGVTKITPLMMACEEGNPYLVSELLTHNAKVNVEDKNHTTPLIYAALSPKLRNVPLTYSLHCIELLLARHADVNVQSYQGDTALSAALQTKNVEAVKLLIAQGANTKLRVAHGTTLLQYACQSGSLELVELFLKHNQDVNTHNDYGVTPLMNAIMANSYSIVKLLLQKGAAVNARDKSGNTPIFFAIDRKSQTKGKTTVLSASKAKEEHSILRLLIRRGAIVNIQNDTNQSPLMLAISKGSLERVKLLLKAGAIVNISDRFGNTPLTLALKRGNPQIVQLLEKYER